MANDSKVCWQCIPEPLLKKRAKRKGSVAVCEFCNLSRKCVPFLDIVNQVAFVLHRDIVPGEMKAILSRDGDRVDHEVQRGETIDFWISECLGTEDTPLVAAIQSELTEFDYYQSTRGGQPAFSEEVNYVSRRTWPHDIELQWEKVKLDVMHGKRFFNLNAKSFFQWLFKDIDQLQSIGIVDQAVVRTLNHRDGTLLHRARRANFSVDAERILNNPMAELGPPPRVAATAGRMNPSGVPVFYAAFDINTCISELRPPVGATLVSAQFSLTRSIRVLDLTALESAYSTISLSPFDDLYQEAEGRRNFLNTLHKKINSPVLPGAEHEYLITQVISEYLSSQHVPRIDAVIFASAQSQDGLNIVIFSDITSQEGDDDLASAIASMPQPNFPVEYIDNSVLIHTISSATYRYSSSQLGLSYIKADDYDDAFDGGWEY